MRHALLPSASRGVLQTRYPAASLALCAVAHPGVFAIWTLVVQPCIPSSV